LGEGTDYGVQPRERLRSQLCMFAYDMNDEPLTVGLGALSEVPPLT
jgi:hypothetical protein